MDDFFKAALEMAKAQAGVRVMDQTEMVKMVKELAASLKEAAEGTTDETAGGQVSVRVSPEEAKKSIREKSITCLECGKGFKIISSKHLATHGLTSKTYIEKFGLKKGTSLACKGLARQRREKMSEMQLWKRKGSAKESTLTEPQGAARATGSTARATGSAAKVTGSAAKATGSTAKVTGSTAKATTEKAE